MEHHGNGAEYNQRSLPDFKSDDLREGNSAEKRDITTGKVEGQSEWYQSFLQIVIYQIGFSGCELPYQISINAYAYLWGAVSNRRKNSEVPPESDVDLVSSEVWAVQLPMVLRVSD